MPEAEYKMSPIGRVKCAVNTMSEGGWGKVDSEIHLDAKYAPGLQGLAGFSHILVLFLLDRSQDFDIAKQLLRRPRGMEDLDPVGVFAQRTKYRPNPLAVTAVKLLGIEGPVLKVHALDALDGTPVLDIKPVMAEFLPRGTVRQPDWSRELMADYW